MAKLEDGEEPGERGLAKGEIRGRVCRDRVSTYLTMAEEKAIRIV